MYFLALRASGLMEEEEFWMKMDALVTFLCWKAAMSHTFGRWPPFNFDRLTEHEVRLWFRFEKADFPRVIAALQLPDVIVTPRRRYSYRAREALCVLLW